MTALVAPSPIRVLVVDDEEQWSVLGSGVILDAA